MLYVLNSPLIYLDDTGLARLENASSYDIYIKDAAGNTISVVHPGQIIGTQGIDDGFDGIYNPLDDPNKPGSPATLNDAPVGGVVRKFNDYANITIIDAYDPTGKPSIMFYHNTDISANVDALDVAIGRSGWKDNDWIKLNPDWPAQPIE